MTPPDDHGVVTFVSTWAASATVFSFIVLVRLWIETNRTERAEHRAQKWEDHARKLQRRTTSRDYTD